MGAFALGFVLIPTPTSCDPTTEDDLGIIIRRQVANVVCVGDSLTRGLGATTPGSTGSYPFQLATSLGLTYGFRVINLGVDSLGVEGLVDPDFLLDNNNTNWLIVWAGTNNIYPAGQAAAATFSTLQTYITARVAAGWNVIVCTLTGGAAAIMTAPKKAIAAAYDALIRAAYSRIADNAANSNIGNASSGSLTYFDADQYHLNDTGYGIVRGLVEAQMTGSVVRATRATGAGYDRTGLTGYYRDWVALSPATAQPDISPIYSLHALSQASGTFTSSGTFPQWVTNVTNGRPGIRFAAASSNFAVGPLWSAVLSPTACSLRVTFKIHSIATNNTANRNLNDAVFGDASNEIELYLRNDPTFGPYLGVWGWNGGTEPFAEVRLATSPGAPGIGSTIYAEMVIESNKFKLAVNGADFTATGAGGAISSGNANALNLGGQMRIARNGGTAYGDITLLQATMRQDAGNSQRAAYNAADAARYGL